MKKFRGFRFPALSATARAGTALFACLLVGACLDGQASMGTETVTGDGVIGAATADARHWPAEIETVRAVLHSSDDASRYARTITTDQRCSSLDEGLAHCVVLECLAAACVETIVTARRLPELPAATGLAPGDRTAPSRDEGEVRLRSPRSRGTTARLFSAIDRSA